MVLGSESWGILKLVHGIIAGFYWGLGIISGSFLAVRSCDRRDIVLGEVRSWDNLRIVLGLVRSWDWPWFCLVVGVVNNYSLQSRGYQLLLLAITW